MLHVITGGPGVGKTLLTLKDIRERSVREARPVYYFNIRLKGEALTWGWHERDPREWQEFERGAIVVCDEAHKYFGKRAGIKEPPHVEMLAEHRSLGMDFYFITQHVNDLDIFIRRRVAAPGWHRHLKRRGGAELVSVLQFNTVREDAEKQGSAAYALVETRPYPREVYQWYESADLHTAKFTVPRIWYYMGLGVVGCVALFGLAGNMFMGQFKGKGDAPAAKQQAAAPASPGRSDAGGQGARVLTAQEYVAMRQPRLPGFPNTAPIYDGVTAPTEAPYPAACVEGRRPGAKEVSCDCWTQQGTRLLTAVDICRQIVRNGYFVEWRQAQAGGAVAAPGGRAGAGVAGVPGDGAAAVAGGAVGRGADSGRHAPGGGAPSVDLVSNGRDSVPKFYPALVEAAEPVVSGQAARDAAILSAMRSGQWHRY